MINNVLTPELNGASAESHDHEIQYTTSHIVVADIAATILQQEIGEDEATTIIDSGSLSVQEWPGGVSKRALVAADFTSEEVIDEAVMRIDEFYVPVNKQAKTRCIDGRHDPKLKETELGPQVPGGAPGAALSFVLGVDKDDLTRGSFVTDAETMIDNFIRLGFNPGGHRDTTAKTRKIKQAVAPLTIWTKLSE